MLPKSYSEMINHVKSYHQGHPQLRHFLNELVHPKWLNFRLHFDGKTTVEVANLYTNCASDVLVFNQGINPEQRVLPFKKGLGAIFSGISEFYNILGEAILLGQEKGRSWDRFSFLQPGFIEAHQKLGGERSYYLRPSEELKALTEVDTGISFFSPEIRESLNRGNLVPVDVSVVARMAAPWDLRGTPSPSHLFNVLEFSKYSSTHAPLLDSFRSYFGLSLNKDNPDLFDYDPVFYRNKMIERRAIENWAETNFFLPLARKNGFDLNTIPQIEWFLPEEVHELG